MLEKINKNKIKTNPFLRITINRNRAYKFCFLILPTDIAKNSWINFAKEVVDLFLFSKFAKQTKFSRRQN